MKYIFDEGECKNGEVAVLPSDLYESDKGYGFLTEANRKQEKRLSIPELNSGFDVYYWFYGMEITKIEKGACGCKAVSPYEGVIPCCFKCNVEAEGNYRVTVTLKAECDVDEGILFLGRRRMGVRKKFFKGECFKGTFLTNICPIIPRNYEDVMEDTSLDVTITGRGLCFCEIEVEPVQCPTIYIAGDSTVTDQSGEYPYVPSCSYCGWGQMLGAYVGEEMAVSNHSHSGLTTESFRMEGHYDILLNRIGKGDYCLIQFGHNDQKLAHLKAREGYRRNLERYIHKLREKGGKPVLVTPLARNTWKGGEDCYNDLLTEYQEVVIETGKALDVPVVDLHESSKDFILKMGREGARPYFFPSDYTHSNDYGAYLFAGMVYDKMCKMGLLKEHHVLPEWLPQDQEMPKPPEELKDVKNPMEEDLFANVERQEDILTRTESLEFVISCMHFFPTNVYNDMFSDVIGHETYAGTVECGVQNGIIPREVIDSGVFRPLEPVTGAEFFEFLVNGYGGRKSDTLNPQELLPEGFLEKKKISRREGADICRKLHI